MQTMSLALSPGISIEVHATGAYFHLLETDSAVDIDFMQGGAVFATASAMEGGYFSRPVGGFSSLRFTSANAQTIKIAISDGAGGYQRTAGTVNIVNTQGDTIADLAPVAVGVAAILAAAAVNGTKGLRFFNNGAADVYLGGAGVTTVNGAIKLASGDVYFETEAAIAAWYAISGTAGQNLRVQRVS